MTQQLPAPLTPAAANLTDFAFMPLEVARLRASKAWLICKRRPDVAFYMLNLWTSAWHERPAGSLEDDDDVLADRAMCSPDRWPEVKADALRGWVKCSDGRLYHPIVCEKVNEAWASKRQHAYSKERDRLAKGLKRAGVKKITDDMLPDFSAWDRIEASGGQFTISDGQVVMSSGRPKDTLINVPDVRRTPPVCPAENALKGQGEGQGQGEGYISGSDDVSGGRPAEIPGCPADNSDDEKSRYPDPRPDLTVELNEREHHDRFVRFIAGYPEYGGAPRDLVVEAACRRLIELGEETWDTLDGHRDRFANFVRLGGRSEPRYVDHPLKWISDPALRRAPWDPPKSKSDQRLSANLANAEQARRELLEESDDAA